MKQVIDEQKPDEGKRQLPKNLQLGQFIAALRLARLVSGAKLSQEV